MNIKSWLRPCALCLAGSVALAASAAPVGVFESEGDVGAVGSPGSAHYDPESQSYTIVSSGANMWAGNDELHFVWRRVTGDFVLQSRVEWEGRGAEAHRKAGLLVRSSLSPDSPHVNACLHGDGLGALQFRRAPGAPTEELRFDEQGPEVLELRREGRRLTVCAARKGELYSTRSVELALGDSVYVGLYVCAHDNKASETAVFRNVRLIRPAKAGFVPYRDYIGSDLEVLDLATGRRKVLTHVADSLQAPNWTPDGRSLVCNHNGRMLRFGLASLEMAPIDTGTQVQCNNDHALSFDGRLLGISSGQPSRVFVLPSQGGSPRLVTPLGPSYFHGFSPDGKTLAYTAERNGDYDIYTVSAGGGPEKRLTQAPGLDDGSEYTPDGAWIYFNSVRTGRMQVWRMRPDGSGQQQLTFDDANNWFPHVSPDGRTIVFITYGPEVAASDHPFYRHVYLRLMPSDGGKPVVIAYLYGGQGSMNVNSWSPDGAQLAFVANADSF